MTRYKVVHRTTYQYSRTVVSGHSVARLTPRELPHQHVCYGIVDADPLPSARLDDVDRFGNQLTSFVFDEPHDRAVIVAQSELDLTEQRLPGGLWHRPWEDAAEATVADTTSEGLLARRCLGDSPRVVLHPELLALARQAFTPGRLLADAAWALTQEIFKQMEFRPGTTSVDTPALEALQQGGGVCQDFTHVALGALRSLGLGARYVSGYIETEPLPGLPRLIGADASHAWVGLYVPGQGWVDLDPTNGMVQPDRHLTVAWGRDYSDVAPVTGIVRGPVTEQELSIAVEVTRL